MPAELLMLDSGAFAVWSRQEKVDLNEYIKFCEKYSECDYFVNLDVIPGKPNDIKSLSLTEIESACEQGWKNYQKMIKILPHDKVMPVFHQGDDFDWLRRFVDSGAEYIGISPANDRTTNQRLKWLTADGLLTPSVKKIVTNQKGDLITKTHGFAVTSNRLMACSFPWTSVDSATCLIAGGLGMIFVPIWKNDAWDYSVDPWIIHASDRSPNKVRDAHIDHLSAEKRRCVVRFLTEEKMGPGQWETRKAKPGDKPNRENERWASKDKKEIITVLKKGIRTDDQARKWTNIRYFQRAGEALGVKVFIAGGGANLKLEGMVRYRLQSYAMMDKASFLFHYNPRVK